MAREGAPLAFAAARGVRLPSAAGENTSIGGGQIGPPPLALAGYTIFLTTGTSVQVISATTGQAIGSVKPAYTVPNPPGSDEVFAGSAAAPALVENIQGQQVALVGYVVELPGRGTTPPSFAVEVDAVDTSAHRLWRIVAPFADQPAQLTGDPTVTFVGSSGSAVVAAVGDDDDGYSTVAFDTASHTVLWQSASFLARTVVGSTAVGTTDTSESSGIGANSSPDMERVAAVNVRSGKTGWQQSEGLLGPDIQQGGSGTVLVEAQDYSTSDDIITLLHVSTGKSQTISRQQGTGSNTSPWRCWFDGQVTVVCDDAVGGGRAQAAFALNGSTGQLLWQLPDKSKNRIAPTIDAVYDGLVYGDTQSGPVVLDAKTGQDLNDSPGIAPVVVDPDVGIADNGSSGLDAYPATLDAR